MKITIVGGGTIGWLTAFILSKKSPFHTYTVIESSKHPIIGVGESLTGLMTDVFLDPEFQLNELEFLKKTWSLPKYGINFINWQNNKEKIWSPIEGSFTQHKNFDEMFYYCLNENISKYSSYSGLVDNSEKIPFYLKEDKLIFPSNRSYSYHVDAYKFSEFFKEKSPNVITLDKSISDIEVESDTIKKLIFDDGETHEADFYIDASGFSKVLVSKLNAYNIDYSLRLPSKSALIFKPKEETSKKSHCTNAIARDYGWQFEIPTRHKIGRGYVYGKDFTKKEHVIKELEKDYGEIEEIKTIHSNTTQLENSWIGNCLSLGLSASFIEPLQASSLHIAHSSLEYFYMNCLGQNFQETCNSSVREDYNNYVFNFNENAIDFVQATYLTGRKDTDFWKFMNEVSHKSDKLNEIISLTKHRLSRSTDFDRFLNYVGQSNWNYTLQVMNIIDKKKIKRTFETLKINEQNLHEMYVGYKSNYFMDDINNNYMTVEELNDYLKDDKNG